MFGADHFENPGIDAFFRGQKRGEERAGRLSDLASADVQRQSALQRMFQEAEIHPLRKQEMQDISAGRGLDRQRTKGLISDEERKRRMDATDQFFRHLRIHDDPAAAAEYSGVPPQFAERFQQMTPEQRKQLDDLWIERAQRPERKKREHDTDQRIREVKAGKEADFRRAQMQQEETTRRALEVAKLRIEAQTRAAEEAAVKITNTNYQQYATQLMRAIAQARQMPETTPEQKEAKYTALQELVRQLDAVVLLDHQARTAAAQQRQAGQPDIGRMGGGQIPTRPDVQPHLPGAGLAAPQQPAQPAAPRQFTPGQVYRGRTGTFRYIGGDPKNPASWERVQ